MPLTQPKTHFSGLFLVRLLKPPLIHRARTQQGQLPSHCAIPTHGTSMAFCSQWRSLELFLVGGRKGKGCGFSACHSLLPRELDLLCGCGMNSALNDTG